MMDTIAYASHADCIELYLTPKLRPFEKHYDLKRIAARVLEPVEGGCRQAKFKNDFWTVVDGYDLAPLV